MLDELRRLQGQGRSLESLFWVLDNANTYISLEAEKRNAHFEHSNGNEFSVAGTEGAGRSRGHRAGGWAVMLKEEGARRGAM